jgi:uncharacterized protein YjlB
MSRSIEEALAAAEAAGYRVDLLLGGAEGEGVEAASGEEIEPTAVEEAVASVSNENHISGAEAPVDSVGIMRGLKPPPPSDTNFSAESEAQPSRTEEQEPAGTEIVPAVEAEADPAGPA